MALCRCTRCVEATERPVLQYDLVRGASTGCGCFKFQKLTESRLKTGHSPRGGRSITHTSWKFLRKRYRERVVPEWRDLARFIIDVGERPSPSHHLKVTDVASPMIGPAQVRWEIRRSSTNPKTIKKNTKYARDRHEAQENAAGIAAA